MSLRIYKYRCQSLGEIFELEVHPPCIVKHFGEQEGDLFFWAEVDADLVQTIKRFIILPTGGELRPGFHHVGTAQIQPLSNMQLVWHLYAENS